MSTEIVERDQVIHPILSAGSLPRVWTLAVPDQGESVGAGEEILAITIDGQYKLACEIKSPDFPVWAVEKIRDLQNRGKLRR